ncbi:hypothetical protein ACJMK2_006567 [Sinanodonta woodiana]|uniref:DUSP domain-containing protein n=1 Tax=Sinanodonta woodiana TaxID=1069815 RepID=A0ABD3VWR6_SINWO
MMPSYSTRSSSNRGSPGSTPYTVHVAGSEHAVHKYSSQEKLAKMTSITQGPTIPDPLAQRAIIEQHFERRLVEGEFWFVVVAEWLEQVKKYLGIPSTRKYFQQRVHPGAIITRRDYAHTVEVIHEDAWKLLLQWYGLAEGHKPIKLVVYNYARAPEIEHHLNSFKVMLTNAPPEDFQNVRFSKMEKVGHIEWKIRQLYNIPLAHHTRMWAKPDQDGEWRPILVRDKAIGKALDIDSDFIRPYVALEVQGADGMWRKNPDNTQATQDCPIGILYDHDIFEDVTGTWEFHIHEQIDHIGKDFVERLHINFGSFVQRAKEYLEEKDSILRERERKLCCRESYIDGMKEELEEKEQRLDAEMEVYQTRRKLFEEREERLEKEYEEKRAEMEKISRQRKAEMDHDREALEKERDRFERELKRMSEMYKIQENKIKLDIGGHQFTTSLLTLTKDPNSMLAAMFSGRHELRSDSDGSYFIDRDGVHFRYILNYLRDGCIKEGTLPNDENVWRELLIEAEYYQTEGLVKHLRSLVRGVMSRSSSTTEEGAE